MQRSKKLTTHSVRQDLEDEYSSLMRQRKQIQNQGGYKPQSSKPAYNYKNPYQKATMPSPIPKKNDYSQRMDQYEDNGGNFQSHEIKAIQDMERRLTMRIDQEKAQNQQIRSKIHQIQLKSQQQRRKSMLLEKQLQQITGIPYSRKNNQNNENVRPVPSNVTPPTQNSIKIPKNDNTDIQRQIKRLENQNAILKNKKNNQTNLQELKFKISETQRVAEEYQQLSNKYRKIADKKLQSKSFNSQLSVLFAQSQKIKNQAIRLQHVKASSPIQPEQSAVNYNPYHANKPSIVKDNTFINDLNTQPPRDESFKNSIKYERSPNVSFPSRLNVKSITSTTYQDRPKIEKKNNYQSILEEMKQVTGL